ncbi:MAG: fibronectin type III domain-containing protein, partial [bacterium]|nr:fibronectin type III domain-containing protein [bacterium]
SLVITALNSRTKLVWQAPASNGGSAITGYKIYRGTSSGGETLLTTLGNVFLYLDKSNLNNGTTYYYKVTAINGVGDSSYSNEVSGSPINSYSVFISSATYNGNLGGLSGADVKCQSLANTQSIGGSWKAWLSSSVTSASSRLYHPAVPYKLLTGTTVVNNWTDLTDGTIASPINKTESGNTNGGSTWTNTNSNGTVYSSNTSLTCQDWTSSLGYPSVPLSYVVRYGSGGATNSGWTAYNSAGCNNNLNLYCFEQPVVSDAPQNLLATATTSVTVYLTWQAPFNGTSAITNYKIYRGTSSGGESLIATIGNLLVYNDTSLTIGPAYYYKVTAVNAIGESVFSNESSATPYAGISLAPTITKAVAANARVPIYWSTPSSDGGSAITSYKIYRGTSSGGETLLYTVGNLLNYLDYNSIINGITYYYKISAVNNIGESALSNEINVTPNNLALVFITSSTYSANLGGVAGADSICQVKADSVSLGGSWKAWLSDSNTSAASRFYHSPVFYKTVNGSTIANNWSDLTDGSISSYLYVTEMGANASSFAAWTNTTFGGSALGNSCINWTSISSSNSGGYGFASNLNSGWTQSSISTCNTTSRLYCFEQSGPPSAPPNLNVIPGIGQAILDWQAPSSDGGSPITNYKIYRGTSSGGETLLTTLGNVLTYTDNSLGIGTYYYKVSAVNSIGEGVLSNEARTSMDFSLSSSPPSNSLVQGSFVTTTVTITKIDGPAVSVSLSASGLPAGVTASFNPTSCTPNNTCTSTLTLNVSAPAPVGTYPITINGTDGYSTKSTTHTLTILLQASVSYKRVFLTSSKFNGNLGGLSGADSQCQTIASGIGLGGSWKAWLSSGSISASSRLTHASAPYKLLTGSTVANNWTDLTDASLSTAISVDETGKNHPSNELLDSWTNASTNGGIKSSSIYDHCSNWTVGTNQLGGIYIYGYLGYVNGTDYAWTDWLNSNDVCSIPHNLYCFEQ